MEITLWSLETVHIKITGPAGRGSSTRQKQFPATYISYHFLEYKHISNVFQFAVANCVGYIPVSSRLVTNSSMTTINPAVRAGFFLALLLI